MQNSSFVALRRYREVVVFRVSLESILDDLYATKKLDLPFLKHFFLKQFSTASIARCISKRNSRFFKASCWVIEPGICFWFAPSRPFQLDNRKRFFLFPGCTYDAEVWVVAIPWKNVETNGSTFCDFDPVVELNASWGFPCQARYHNVEVRRRSHTHGWPAADLKCSAVWYFVSDQLSVVDLDASWGFPS